LKFRLFFPLKDNVKGAKEDIWTRERGVKEWN
jgi:sarcosine oxidase delta subunit